MPFSKVLERNAQTQATPAASAAPAAERAKKMQRPKQDPIVKMEPDDETDSSPFQD
ncbi:hypothetical protein LTR60_004498, partial [Cryomyces antarcticus]